MESGGGGRPALLWLLCLLLTCGARARTSYRAAVYDHAILAVPQQTVWSRAAALARVNTNMDVLEEQAKFAKEQGADIFVFPEYGLIGRLGSRTTAFPFLETIPDPTMTAFCPCSAPPVTGQEILRRLSCAAKETSMYLAANMGDKQPCLLSNLSCPLSGFHLYNTEVVFNRSGCLIARYHKQHLFEREKLIWDEPRAPEISYFDTDFGRFGLMICFDAVFRSPAADLVEKYNVTDIIFSTAWMNVFPHFVSVAYHSGWARTMKVNYLMSNLHFISLRFVGSGIFSPAGIVDYAYNLTSAGGTLVVADVPINRRNQPGNPTSTGQLPLSAEPSAEPNTTSSFTATVFDDQFTFVPLSGVAGRARVCDEDVCCQLDFTRSESSELYALGAFSGMHHKEGTYYLEVCLLVHCKYDNKSGCGQQPADSVTEFSALDLTGSMTTRYAYPQVVSRAFNFSTPWDFNGQGSIKTISIRDPTSLLSVVLMGRDFDRDAANGTTNNMAATVSCDLKLVSSMVALILSANFL